MDKQEILHQIGELAEEERALEESHVGEGLSSAERDRLEAIQVSLDQCWDLLRQREARRHAGQDPDDVHVRPPEVVERYQQ